MRRTSSGDGGKLRSFFTSIALIVLGIAIVFGVGYWVTGGSLTDKATDGKDKPKAGDTAGTAPQAGTAQPGTSEPGTTPAQPANPAPAQPAAPAPTQPATPAPAQPATPTPTAPVDTSDAARAAVLAERAHIDRSAGAASIMKVTVYYGDGLADHQALQPVEIQVPKTVSRIKVTAEQVIAAPEDLKLYSSVPAGTVVQSVNLKDGVAIVDLSREAAGVQGSLSANEMTAAFVYSLTEIPNVNAVKLLINGRPALLHGIVWDTPKTRDDVRNLFSVQPVIKFEP